MPYLRHLRVGNFVKNGSEDLIAGLHALGVAQIRLNTLEIDGPGFGDDYVACLNKIWEIFPSIRITRLLRIGPVSVCNLDTLQIPESLQALEISASRALTFRSLGPRGFSAPEINRYMVESTLQRFVDSPSFQRLKIDIFHGTRYENQYVAHKCYTWTAITNYEELKFDSVDCNCYYSHTFLRSSSGSLLYKLD
ncbi:hypothetical protein AOL_s00088g5 [Orbilia oligospora ATCC 24927]|uniref:Uncharacterized protein n=2 Tax=Orbilia oligospora TaxID=2813651 RepID=G1XHP2_ARTOA|nr:hypothetical protein AOL_s00088g5 [Orbilia oligospora ATCC 24927]EGX47290.1 hypothetical protein AOL_s00088g5 [Orbilia oligospora ATCC 24927]KAF3270551.1 hypothetical protein TWF970_010754 [Orbilia oligospora]